MRNNLVLIISTGKIARSQKYAPFELVSKQLLRVCVYRDEEENGN